jgi:hypothetical protein
VNCSEHDAIRKAFSSGEFAKGERLWNDHSRQLREAIVAGAATEKELSETGELIAWCRLAVKVFRAHAACRLTSVYVTGAYSTSKPTPARIVRVSF